MGLGHSPDGSVRTQKVVLPHHLIQGLRAQTVGQRTRRLRRQAGGFKKIAHGDKLYRLPLKGGV